MSVIPFEGPKFASAKRILGFVDIPENKHAAESALDWGNRSFGPGGGAFVPDADVDANTNQDDRDEKLAGPTHLKRTSTLAGNILVIENEGSESHSFWLQRKVGHTTNGTVRLGFVLLSSSTAEGKVWSLASGGDEGEEEAGMNYQMVAIKILDTSVLDSDHKDELHNPIAELSALQMVADHYEKTGKAAKGRHVIATKLVAVSSQNVFAVLPYHPDGTLFQYCLAQGSLKEPVARFFFQQILKGMETLQEVGLCHRNLSLDSITMDGGHLQIARLGWSLRVGKGGNGKDNTNSDETKPVPPPGGSSPQYIAPEVFQNNALVWDGFAADLWACGLMLYSMVVSSQALFVAPIPEDRLFIELCVKGNIGAQAEKFGKMTNQENLKLSDNLIDLLQNLLQVDPKKRMTLDKILEHPWVKDGNVEEPSHSSLTMM